ncbi:MAG TPA: tetratricopeptide repeat protein [Caulobacteraceae bacterium]
MKTLRPLALAAIFGAVALAAAAPVLAQVPLDPLDDHSAKRLDRMEQALREIRAIVFQGRETGKPVVVEPADTESQLTAVSQKIDDLQQAITRLTGQLESAGHDVDEARHDANQLREENGALTARIAALEQKVAALQAPPPAPAQSPEPQADTAPPPPALDAPAAFAAARQAYNAGDYAGAETGFHDVVTRFGDTPRGLEARYFLAKIMLQRQAYADAAATDLAVVRGWPTTSWAPDAALDLARAMVGMKEAREACGMLGEIDSHYPKASAQVRTGVQELRSQAGCAAG